MAKRPYLEKVYRLKANPFESRTDPNVRMAGRRQEKKAWTNAVDRRKGRPTNAINFIVGDYGSGKTLSLYKIIEQYKNDADVLSIFMKILPEDRVAKFGVDFIQRIFREIPQDVFNEFKKAEIDKLKEVYPEPAKIFEFVSFNDPQAKLFLTGEGAISASQMQKFGINRKILSTHIAKEYLIGFLFLIRSLGKKTLLIAVDEVEYVFSQMRGANISLVFNTLRDLHDLLDSRAIHDLAVANIIFFMGISEAGWTKFTDLSNREQAEGGPFQPLLRRFGEVIALSPLSLGETRDLISLRLSSDRVDDEATTPLIPYDETFVKYVHDLSLGNPSEIIKFCDYALEEGIRLEAKLLDADFAKKVFIDHGLEVAEET